MNWSPIINRLFDELGVLQNEIGSNELYRFYVRVVNLKYSYRLYQENLNEFKNYAIEKNLPPIHFPLSDPVYSDAIFDFLITLSRHLFNVLSSAFMYVDHSLAVKDIVCKRYPDFQTVYNDNVSSVAKESDIFAFMKDMRRYFVHYSIPTFEVRSHHPEVRVRSHEDLFVRELHLDTKRLLEWKDLSRAGRRHIESASSEFSFYRTLEKYDEILQKTYNEFVKTFSNHFSEDLKYVNSKVLRHNRIRSLLDSLTVHNRNQQLKHNRNKF